MERIFAQEGRGTLGKRFITRADQFVELQPELGITRQRMWYSCRNFDILALQQEAHTTKSRQNKQLKIYQPRLSQHQLNTCRRASSHQKCMRTHPSQALCFSFLRITCRPLGHANGPASDLKQLPVSQESIHRSTKAHHDAEEPIKAKRACQQKRDRRPNNSNTSHTPKHQPRRCHACVAAAIGPGRSP